MGKGNQWGYTVTEAVGSTCNIRKLTGKGQVKRKHRSEAYGHQKLKQKGNQGSWKWVFMHRTPSGMPEVPEGIAKVLEGSRRLGVPQKGVSGLYEGYRT